MNDKIINIGIVGLGTISKHHINGILNVPKYNIYAVCDMRKEEETVAKELECKFYQDYKEMAKDENIDLILILTPPLTHYEISKYMLQHKKHVIVEKPGIVENISQLYDLIAVSKENNVSFDVIFHWMYASETLYLTKHFEQFGKLLKVEANVYDPYTIDGQTIKPEKVDLNGAWNDSGINVLSMFGNFLDMDKMKLDSERLLFDDRYNLPIYAKKNFKYGEIDVTITVDWRYNRNHKSSVYYFEQGALFVDHTAQDLFLNANRVETFYTEDRLTSHYTNLFTLYTLNDKNHDLTIKLHKLLLQTRRNILEE